MKDLIPPLILDGEYLQSAEGLEKQGKQFVCPLCGCRLSKTKRGFKHTRKSGCAGGGDTRGNMAFVRFMENAERHEYVVFQTVCPGALPGGCSRQRPEQVVWKWEASRFSLDRERKIVLRNEHDHLLFRLSAADAPLPGESTILIRELLESESSTIHVYQRCQTCDVIARARAKMALAKTPPPAPSVATQTPAERGISEVSEQWKNILNMAALLSTPAVPSPLTRESEQHDSFTWNLL